MQSNLTAAEVVTRLAVALEDAVSYLRGEVQGRSQLVGILKDADEAIAAHDALPPDDAAATIRALVVERDRMRRAATDQTYMLAAVVRMLGPKGSEVWQKWQAKGVQRIHVSWGPDAEGLAGEDIADLHLQVERACESATPFDSAATPPTDALRGEGGS